ncbi:CYTH domain-containing protein [Neoroseomonas soli]|uniref:CYTH domain-containing protein n=1 Tax=Neoroseomonas soli TaxID=1081025 RepID=UPI001BA60533|nr:CYTH domain-containing protein [Neoroseomonas soli]
MSLATPVKTEIERKFLVAHDGWKAGVVSNCRIRDGLVAVFGGGGKVRVRIAGEEATIALKGPRDGLARAEFEFPVPVAEAEAMLAAFCHGPIVEKTRHLVPHDGLTWEVDVYHGLLAGTVYAEVELAAETQHVTLPGWVGQEVTGDPRHSKRAIVAAWLAADGVARTQQPADQAEAAPGGRGPYDTHAGGQRHQPPA